MVAELVMMGGVVMVMKRWHWGGVQVHKIDTMVAYRMVADDDLA
jgi:hypothetical protein